MTGEDLLILVTSTVLGLICFFGFRHISTHFSESPRLGRIIGSVILITVWLWAVYINVECLWKWQTFSSPAVIVHFIITAPLLLWTPDSIAFCLLLLASLFIWCRGLVRWNKGDIIAGVLGFAVACGTVFAVGRVLLSMPGCDLICGRDWCELPASVGGKLSALFITFGVITMVVLALPLKNHPLNRMCRIVIGLCAIVLAASLSHILGIGFLSF